MNQPADSCCAHQLVLLFAFSILGLLDIAAAVDAFCICATALTRYVACASVEYFIVAAPMLPKGLILAKKRVSSYSSGSFALKLSAFV